ncbi:MAG: response regulator [Fibrobacterota bacterium]
MQEIRGDTQEVVILIADDDDGHAELIRRNLKRSGISNTIIRFKNGVEITDFIFRTGTGLHRDENIPYVLLLDIRMPQMDGVEVLEKMKTHGDTKKIPVIMLTTTDDPREVEQCHLLGCNNYITKPVEYTAFANAIRQLGLFLSVVQIPRA